VEENLEVLDLEVVNPEAVNVEMDNLLAVDGRYTRC
jgi:hypothetical protein